MTTTPTTRRIRVLVASDHVLLADTFAGALGSRGGYGQPEAGPAAVFGYLNPLVGGVAAAVVLGKPLSAPVVLDGPLLLAGIGLANRR